MKPSRPAPESAEPEPSTQRQAHAEAVALKRQSLARWLFWITPAVWSSNYLIARAAAGVMPPHLLAFGRWATALAIMLAWQGPALAAAWRAQPGLVRREGGQWLVLGGLGMWICGAFVYLGGQTTQALNIALIYAAAPIAIAWIGSRLAGRRLRGPQVLAMVLAAAGVVFVASRGQPLKLLAVDWVVGDLWILAAMVSWVAYSVLLAHWPSALAPPLRLMPVAAGGLLVMAPFTLLELLQGPVWQPSWAAAGLVLAAAVLPGVLSYQAYSFMIRELGAAHTAVGQNLSPLYAALLAWLLLGEAPRWDHVVGAALILPGVFLATRPPAKD